MQFRLATVRWSKALWWALLSLAFTMTAVWLTNRWIAQRAAPRVFLAVEAAPARNVALVLGTAAKTYGGYANPFFQNRIEAAAATARVWKSNSLECGVRSAECGV